MQIPVSNGEGLQVLHYQVGELYQVPPCSLMLQAAPGQQLTAAVGKQAHFDYFHDSVNVKNGGQRVATMLMYLTDVDEGGETVFPDSVEKPVRPALRVRLQAAAHAYSVTVTSRHLRTTS